MMKSTTVLFFSFVLFALPQVMAQKGIPEKIGDEGRRGPSIKALENRAKRSYEAGKYGDAIKYYEFILDSINHFNVTALQGLADASIAYTSYEKAAAAYDTLRSNKLVEIDGAFLLRHAEIKYLLHDYDGAKADYKEADQISTSADVKSAAKIGINNCEWAEKIQKEQKSDFEFERQEYVNTPYSEYSNVWYDKHKQLYYSSYSQPYKEDSTRLIFQIMTAQRNEDGTLDLIRMSDLNEPNKHTAYISFNADTTAMYYAIGDFSKKKRIEFNLYRRKLLGDGRWGDPEKLPEHINAPKSSTSQPFVCTLAGDSTEILFFVSDRPGGKGEKDIWFCKIENGTYSQPENLSQLNTEGDDISPFYHASTDVLYFSSSGRQSLGGFDIYSSKRQGKIWAEPEHLPVPLNSRYNDIFYFQSEDGNTMFLSTNRSGTVQFSPEDCCYDIIKYCKPQQMTVSFCNEASGEFLDNVTMSLYETSDSGESLIDDLECDGSSHAFSFTPNNTYKITASKPGFHSNTVELQSPPNICDAQLDTICLKPVKVDLIVDVVDCDSSGRFTGANLQLSKLNLSGSVLSEETRDEPEASNYQFNLVAEHNYDLKASSEGVTAIADPISTMGLIRDTTIHRVLRLGKSVELLVSVYDEVEETPVNDVIISLFEQDNGGEWVNIWTDSTGADRHSGLTPISYDKQYRIEVVKSEPLKKKYNKGFREFATVDMDKTACQQIARDIPLRQIPDLPITLYFDNDEPGPHTSFNNPRPDIPKKYIDIEEFNKNFVADLQGLFDRPRDSITRRDTLDAIYGRFVDIKTDRTPNLLRDINGPFWHVQGGKRVGAYVPLSYADVYLGFVTDAEGIVNREYYCHGTLGHKCNVNRHHCSTEFPDGKIGVPGYYSLKDTYIQRFVEGETGEKRLSDSLHVDAFFEDSVRGEWNRLREVFAGIEGMMLDPRIKKVTIEIRGYASPLGNPAYNQVLTDRRVNSVMTFFQEFDGGVLLEYIYSGKLVLVRQPNGSAKAAQGVSGNRNNRRLSVYSVEASRERRVEVVGLSTEYH